MSLTAAALKKIAHRIAQIEAGLTAMQQESDARTGRVDDPPVPRPLRQYRWYWSD